MLISMKMLKEVIQFDYTSEELAKEFSLLGLEVEDIVKVRHSFKDVITAQVKNIKHIEGTELFSLKAFTGEREFSIVTKATNLQNGDVVPLALPNSVIANGVQIKPRKFGEYVSNGMLCSYKELGIDGELLSSKEKEGIFVFPDDTPIGRPVEEVLPIDDEFLSLSLLPDRADAFYLIGVARWIEILNARNEGRKADFSKFEINPALTFSGKTPISVVVKEKDLAPFYSGRFISNVNVRESSLSMRKKLFMLRVHPINSIVDITNFVLKFYGQPLHSFDADKVKESIIVRNALDGEKIKTLDGVERTLSKRNLVIADKEKALAIAGVMGGEESQVTFNTRNVFLESAYFLPSCISKSSRSLNLMTDASMLFEKGTDPKFPEKASLIATDLILKESGGVAMESNVFSNLGDIKPVNIRVNRIGKLLGETISKEEAKKYFLYEGFNPIDKGDTLEVYYPSFRRDIQIEEDLVEEILRMKGYNSFGEKPIIAPLKSAKRTPFEDFLWDVKDYLAKSGLMEVQTVSLIGKELLSKSLISVENTAAVINPFSEEMSILRPYLFPVILSVVETNKKNGISNIALFETGKTFSYIDKKYIEKENVGIALLGDRIYTNPFKKSIPYDFYYLKGIVESFLEHVGVDFEFKEGSYNFMHPYQTAHIYINGNVAGFLGTVNSEVIKNFEIKQNVYYAEISLDVLFENKNKNIRFEEYPLYPPLKMDVAVVVKEDVPEILVRQVIRSVAPKELKEITLFDVYRGKPLKDDEKNLAYSLAFYSKDRTLKREEVEQFVESLEKELERKIGGRIRKE